MSRLARRRTWRTESGIIQIGTKMWTLLTRSESRNFIGCPAPNLGHYDSHVQVSCPSGPGLAAPVRQGGVPLSLQKQVVDSDTAVNQPAPMQLVPKKRVLEPSNQQFLIPSPPKRQGLDSLVRTRSASSSPIVQSLWSAVVPALVPLSAFLNQVLASVNAQQHVNRLLDTYAASTLVKYLSAVQHWSQIGSRQLVRRVNGRCLAGLQAFQVHPFRYGSLLYDD